MKRGGELLISLAVILGVIAFTKSASNFGDLNMRTNMLIAAGFMAVVGVIMYVKGPAVTIEKKDDRPIKKFTKEDLIEAEKILKSQAINKDIGN